MYPTVSVNRRTQAIQEAELKHRRSQIRRLRTQAATLADEDVDDAATMAEMATWLEIQRLLSSTLLPILFVIFEMYLGRLL